MAQHVNIIVDRLQKYLNSQLASISQGNPLLAFMKPVVSRVINNNIYKVESMLKQVSDKDGLVDVEGILSEMIDSVMNTRPFKIQTEFLGELEIGGGKIKVNLPLIDKALVLTNQDLIKLKDTLIEPISIE